MCFLTNVNQYMFIFYYNYRGHVYSRIPNTYSPWMYIKAALVPYQVETVWINLKQIFYLHHPSRTRPKTFPIFKDPHHWGQNIPGYQFYVWDNCHWTLHLQRITVSYKVYCGLKQHAMSVMFLTKISNVL